jgi:hypothetical protein
VHLLSRRLFLGLMILIAAPACARRSTLPTAISAPDSAAASLRAFAIAHLPTADTALRAAGFTLRGADTTVPIGLSPASVFMVPPDSLDALAQLFMGVVELNTRRLTHGDVWHNIGGPVSLTFAGRGHTWFLLTEDGFLLSLTEDSTHSSAHLDIQAAFRRAFPQQAEMVDWAQARRAILDSLGLTTPPRGPAAPR